MLSNPCIKTGANVYFECYNRTLHCDLFKVDGVFIIHHIGDAWLDDQSEDDPLHLVVWTDRFLKLDTAGVIAIEEAGCSPFDYEGQVRI